MDERGKVAGYVLGVDVGVASLGWALLDVDPQGRIVGVRKASAFIYPSGGDETAERRTVRAARHRLQRRRRRLKRIAALLVETLGARPGFDGDLSDQGQGAARTSRVALRARGLGDPLSADDLARAIMHIARNRGMRLTRVFGEDADADKARKELGQMASESQQTVEAMRAYGAVTPGAFLHALESEDAPDHRRPPIRRRRGTDASHRFLRTQVQEELEMLLAAQSPHHPGLTPETCREICDQVFEEHAPTPPEIGRCRYFPDERRIRIATDLYQTKRIYEEVNNVRIRYSDGSTEKLTLGQRDLLVEHLLTGRSLKAASVKKMLKLQGAGLTVNLDPRDDDSGKELKGHVIRAKVIGTPLEAIYEDPSARPALDALLRDEKDVDRLANRLQVDHGMEDAAARDFALGLALPPGTAPMGPKATALLLDELKRDVISHTEAVERAGLPDPLVDAGLRERLPYYGEVFPHLVRPVRVAEGQPGFGHPAAPLEVRYGRIPNPVVHKAFNALRKVVNAILKQEGPPLRVQIELSRDMKKTQEQRDEDQKRISRERKRNEEHDRTTLSQGRRPSRKNRRRLRLAELQNWQCPYTGRAISIETLFDGTFDLDHILPRSKTLDDGLGNLVVALEAANKVKGDRSPHEAFANGYVDPETGQRSSWEEIVKRVRSFKDGWKRVRRFSPDAMKRFEDQDAFQARYGADTSYIAKTAAQYLKLICPEVRAVNGHIVAEVRHQWGLASLVAQIQAEEDGCSAEQIRAELQQDDDEARRRRKARLDHRHHVLDAIVTAAIPLSVVQQLQTAAGKGHRAEDGPAVQAPGGFAVRQEAERILRATQVVHRRDHQVNKQLHMETAWGVLARFSDGTYLARRTVRLTAQAFPTLQHLDGLSVAEEYLHRLRADLDAGQARLYWKAERPVEALRRIGEDLEDVRARLLALYEAEPVQEDVPTSDGSAPRRRTRPEAERLASALDRFRAETGRRSALTFARRSLYLIGEPEPLEGGRPRLAYETKGNAWLDVRRREDGTLVWEAVPRILAVHMDADADADTDPPLLRLFIGDTLELGDGNGGRRLCRVMSLSTGDVQLLPANDARPAKASAHGKALRFSSLKRFVALDPVPVLCDPLGRIIWRGPRRNW